MAQLLVKVGDQSPHADHAKDSDIIRIHSDDQAWGRCECLEVWTSEGLDPKDWPGGFLTVEVPDAELSELRFLTDRPAGRRAQINYKTEGVDVSKVGTIILNKAAVLARIMLT